MENRSPENIIYTIFTCAFLFPVAVVMLPVIAMLGIAIYIAIKLARKLNDTVVIKDYDEFKFDKEYYKNIIKQYGVGEIVYTERYYADVEDIVILSLLNLMRDKKIELTKYGFVINDRSKETLRPIESAVLDSITEEGFVKISGKLVREKVKQEIEKTDLLEKANSCRKFKIWEWIVIFIGALLFSWVISKVGYMFAESAIIKTIMDVGNIVFIAIVVPIFVYVYKRASLKRYVRTDKGELLNYKIEGLRQYIIDYMIEGKGISDIELWEDYPFYAVLTKTNEKHCEELYNFIVIKNKYGIIETLDEIF